MSRSLLIALLAIATPNPGRGAGPIAVDPVVTAEESRRVAVVERLSRSTVAIFESTASNGGSGVIISDDGLVVTNYHVTEPCGAAMFVGTNDGRVHDAVLLGLDPTGDIALVRLLDDGPFPAAEIGDSDRVQRGDTTIVAGNPFLLAEDFTPSISIGIVSGVHRYQYPSGSLLEYADCLQTDAAINPGNSGGPLFDGEGRLIGINGRGSFEKRGRVNVGIGYAVSVNQVMRFVSHLKTGRVVDHATLGATVVTRSGPQSIVTAIETDCDAYRRGLRPGDEVVALDGRDTPTANSLLNAIGVLPAHWRARLEFRRDGRLYRRTVRLGPLHAPGELREALGDKGAEEDPPDLDPAVYQAREGYANYAASRAETKRLLAACVIPAPPGPVARAAYEDAAGGGSVTLETTADSAEWVSSIGEFRCDPTVNLASQAAPLEAPAFLGGLWVWSRLAAGEEGLLDEVEAYGRLPWVAGGPTHDVLIATHRGLRVEVYLDAKTGAPLGFEASRDASEDAARVEFGEGTSAALPAEMAITVGEKTIAELRPAPDSEQGGRP